jgi:LEA14-like dessication related protein
MTRLLACVGCAVVALASAGCFRSLPIKQPTTNYRGVTVENVTPDGVDLAFDFHLQNSNDFYLPVTGAGYELALGGVDVVQDVAKPNDAIPPYGARTVTLRARPTFAQLLAAEQAIAGGHGLVPYDFDAHINLVASRSNDLPFPWPNRDVRVPIRVAGWVSLREALEEAQYDPTVVRSPDARRFLDSVLGPPPPREAAAVTPPEARTDGRTDGRPFMRPDTRPSMDDSDPVDGFPRRRRGGPTTRSFDDGGTSPFGGRRGGMER